MRTNCYALCRNLTPSLVPSPLDLAIFRPEESDLHKYSAVLAATEPFRLRCDLEIRRAVNPLKILYYKLRGISLTDPASIVRIENKAVDLACARYEQRVDEILKSYDMNPLTFNSMSLQIRREPYTKQRILLQAYYYRIAADLEANTRNMPELPQSLSLPASLRISVDAERLASASASASRFSRFCRALYAVEAERLRQRETLQTQLGIPDLPTRMCDPEILPAMCSSVQAACSTFPRAVADAVASHGVTMSDFARLNAKLRKDLLFRLRVQGECNKIEREERAARREARRPHAV